MSDSKRKYKSAAFLPVSQYGYNRVFEEIGVHELAEIYKNNLSLFVNKYEGKLFCPECKIPQLSLCKSSNSDCMYLRGYPNQSHSDNCSMGLEELPAKSVTQILNYDDDFSRELISHRLQLAIKSLLKKENTKHQPFVVHANQNKVDLSLIKRTDVHNNGTQKLIPSKSLNVSFLKDDYNQPMIFYGNVKLRWRYKEDGEKKFYILTIYKKGTNQKICSSSMSVAIHDHITNTSDMDNAYIAFFSVMILNKGLYNNFNLGYSSRIIIEMV